MTSLLESINFPADLRRLTRAELPQLARELRDKALAALQRAGLADASRLHTLADKIVDRDS